MTRKPISKERVSASPWWVGPASRVAAMVGLVAVTLTFVTGLNDVYATPKVAVLCLLGLALLGLRAWSLGQSGTSTLVHSRIVWLLGAFLAAMTLSTLLNDHRWLSFLGLYGRGGGLVTYLVAGLLFVVVLSDFSPTTSSTLLRCAAGAAAVVVLYGFGQAIGFEPFGAAPSAGLVISTLGQINFVAGFAGIALPLFLWVLLWPSHSWSLRIAGGIAALGDIVVGVEAHSFQAYLAMAGGAGVLAVAWALNHWSVQRVRAIAFVVGAVALGVVLVGHSQIEREIRSGLDERVLMWEAGQHMVADHPLLGSGPSGYASLFSAKRPIAHVRQFGILQLVDSPHDVPLSMAVTGGFVLLGLYLVFVVVIGRALVQGLRRTRGDRRLLLGAAGGAWLAYQLQSLVSIDVPTLVAFEFVMAALVVLLTSEPGVRSVSFGPLHHRGRNGRPVVTPAGRALQLGVVALVAIGAWFALRPVVADAALARGLDDRASGDDVGALRELRRATSLAPWQATYWSSLAGALAATGDQDAALVAGQKAADLAPSAVSFALSEAQLAARMGRDDVATKYFSMAVRNGPKLAVAYRARADYLTSRGDLIEAGRDLRTAMRLDPNAPTDHLALAAIYEALGRLSDARQEYEIVLRLSPTNDVALHRLGLAP